MEWGADETAQRLIKEKLMEPTIIVAIPNMGEDRIHEYSPTRMRLEEGKRKSSRGRLRQYSHFLIDELKPFIDARYRTLKRPEQTGLGGSSLGGLATMVMGLWFPNVFRRLIVMSPSVWWDNCVVLDMVNAIEEGGKPPLKIWLDTGTQEPGWERARLLRDALIEKGWRSVRRSFLLRRRRRESHGRGLGTSPRSRVALPLSAAGTRDREAAPPADAADFSTASSCGLIGEGSVR